MSKYLTKFFPAMLISLIVLTAVLPVVVAAAPIVAKDYCTTRGEITSEELQKLVPGGAGLPAGQPLAAGTNLFPVGGTQPAAPFQATNAWGLLCTFGIIKQISGILFLLVGIISVIAIVYAAFLFVTAGQNPKNVDQARTYLLYAVIGIIVAVLANLIPTIAITFLGLS